MLFKKTIQFTDSFILKQSFRLFHIDFHRFVDQSLIVLTQLVVVAHIYPPVTGQRQTLTCRTIRTLFITRTNYFVIGEIRTCLGVSDDPMFL